MSPSAGARLPGASGAVETGGHLAHGGPAGACGPFRAPQATFAWCPLCDGELFAEHAHYRCASCGWRDSCCD